MSTSRYIIGIDLGTTNTAVAYVDMRSTEQRVRVFDVAQLVAPGVVEARRQLPSFVYLAGEHDLGPAQTALPWTGAGVALRGAAAETRPVVGELARSQGARVPSRMIASAKSWLCHAGVDRHAAILPWGSDEGVKLSPVEASALVLAQVRAAWDHAHGGESDGRFADQEIIVTVPASFDEAARELTLEAATRAGLPPVVLLEEPQAAFYAWIDAHPGASRSALGAGSHVLVFDIGGGTTDFTMIAVAPDGDGFERTAVGDHLLLGGDNIDLTLAKQVEARIVARAGKKLDSVQWHGLVHACRLAKETLLADESQASATITVAGRGTKLIGGTLKDEISQADLHATIHDGFFPPAAREAAPVRTRGGLQEFGLPYASDPAVTRHLAAFLARHAVERVDAVLFNGGAMTPAGLRARVLGQIGDWQGGAAPPRELANQLPELAVAQGAAYYGLVRRGLATRIKGGTPRAFYIGAGAADGAAAGGEMAVCLAPKGLEEGATVELARDFALVTNRPVSFKLYSSSTRDDQPGTLVPVGDGQAETLEDGSDLLELPPIVAALRARGRGQVTVRLQVRITELGALEIYCTDREPAAPGAAPEKWRLAFDMRGGGSSGGRTGGAAAEARDGGGDGGGSGEAHPRTAEARRLVLDAFGERADKLPGIVKELETMLEARREEWSLQTARSLFDGLAEVQAMRKKSADHEQRWLNLAGLCLRPGTGAPLDQWRAKVMWGVFNEGLAFGKVEACRLAWWIAWRRIAGGLTNGQQEQIFDRLAPLLLPSSKQAKKWHELKPTKQEAAEMWRLVGSLERLSLSGKMKLGDELVRRMADRKGREESLHFWALGRIGARVPLYGPLNAVVPPQKAGEWIGQLLAWDWPEPEKAAFPLAQLGRRTGDRSRDLDDEQREKLAARLHQTPGGERTALLVEQIVALEAREERVLLGDSLPAGLRLIADANADAEADGGGAAG